MVLHSMMMMMMTTRLTRKRGCSIKRWCLMGRIVFYSARGKRLESRGKSLIIDWSPLPQLLLHPVFHRCHRFKSFNRFSMSSTVGFDPMDIVWEEYVSNIDSYGNKFIRNNKIIKLLRSQWFLGRPRCTVVRPRSPQRRPGLQFVGPAFAPHGPGGLDPEGLGPELGSSGGRAHYSLRPPSPPHHRLPLALASCPGSPGKV